MDIKQVSHAYTHAGAFHMDDVISTAFIKNLNPSITVHRVLEAPQNEFCFDIGHGEFDHHQKDRKINRFGYPYSSFGLLWQEYGRQYLKDIGFEKVDKAFDLFEENVVSKVDKGDNYGYKDIYGFYENDMIKAFLPNWFEISQKNMTFDQQFEKAVAFATDVFDNWMRKLFERIELGDIEFAEWQKAKQSATNGYVVLEKNIPWKFLQKVSPIRDLMFVVSQSGRGGYSVSAVDTDVCKVKENSFLHFVHPSQFMGAAHTLEDAINAVNLLVQSA